MFAIGGAMFFGGSIAAFLFLRSKSRLIETMKQTPTSRIASAVPGLVELAGIATPAGALVTAPLTGTRCIFFRVVVDDCSGSSRTTALVHDKWCDFYVDDGSGAVALVTGEVVHVKSATKVVAAEHRDAVQRLFAARGIAQDESEMNQLAWFEERIDPGAYVYVLGEGRPPPPRPDAGYRASAPRERFIVVAPEGGELVVAVGSEVELTAKLRRELSWARNMMWGFAGCGVLFIGVAFLYVGLSFLTGD